MASSLPWRDTTVGSVQKHPNEMAHDPRQQSGSKASETLNEVSADDGRVCLTSKAKSRHPEFHCHDCVTALTVVLQNSATGLPGRYSQELKP